MIILALRAENFMKFSRLNIAGLPPRGLIGIEGPNESGKTTIGEAILFALFGKTRASLETSVSRLIRWGSDYLSVELELDVPGRGQYLIYREIDKYGTNFVKVIERGSRAEVASGNVNVSEFLSRTLRFDFFEFHHSFYHDQIQSGLNRDSQTEFVERMTGTSQIREAVQGLRKDIQELEREFSHYQKDIQRNLQQVERYDRNVAKLPELRELARLRGEEVERLRGEHGRKKEDLEALRRVGEERLDLSRRLERLVEEPAPAMLAALEEHRGRVSGEGGPAAHRDFIERNREELRAQLGRLEAVQALLRDFLALRSSCVEHLEALKARLDLQREGSLLEDARRLRDELTRTQARARRAGKWAAALLLVALLAGGAAAALFAEVLPAPPAGALPPAVVPWGAAGLGTLLALGGALLLWRRALRRNEARTLSKALREKEEAIRQGTEERDRLAALLAISGPGEVLRFFKQSEPIAEPRLAERRRDLLRAHGALVEGEGDGEYRKTLLTMARAEKDLRSRAQRDAQRTEKEVQDTEAVVKRARGDLEKVESEIRECEAQAARKEAVQAKNLELNARSQEIRQAIDLRRVSIELLEDTSASIHSRIGPALSRFLRDLLPRLTRGRYRDIKVGSDLSLQIFTSDKGDFLEPAELSGGTHESLGLALRLATSQAFVASRTRQPQFVFLDEPFKMMDESRALDTLSILPELSADLRQIFVIQPDFTDGQRARFDFLIRTSQEASELALSARPPGESDGRTVREDGGRQASPPAPDVPG